MEAGIIILIAALTVVVLWGAARFVAARQDNVGTDVSRMVQRYVDGEGRAFYRISAGIANDYLLPCEDGYLLVDTGYPEDYPKFKAALAAAGLEYRSIRYLFLTHAHDDHVGFAADLMKETGCRIFAPRESLGDLSAGRMTWSGYAVTRRIAAASFLYDLVKRRTLRFPPVALGDGDRALSEGDADLPRDIGLEGVFLATPGHSGDSWTLLMDDGRAFCGDAAMNYLRSLGADYRPIFLSDGAAARKSVQTLLDRGASMFYTGHGLPFGAETMRGALERHPSWVR